jgi:hypothetical protein
MNEKVINEAVENLSLIRGVIDQTSKSFVAFSRIFIYWGLLFVANGIITVVMNSNKEKLFEMVRQLPVLGFILPIGITALVAALIYMNISRKIPLVGLEKHLMKVWMLILILNVIPNRVRISSSGAAPVDMTNIIVETNNFSVMLFSLAIALIATALFTGYKNLMTLGIVYIGISVLHAYFRLPAIEEGLLRVMYNLPLPFTFLYTGIFLKARQTRGK